jgi:hypothetical protein
MLANGESKTWNPSIRASAAAAAADSVSERIFADWAAAAYWTKVQ